MEVWRSGGLEVNKCRRRSSAPRSLCHQSEMVTIGRQGERNRNGNEHVAKERLTTEMDEKYQYIQMICSRAVGRWRLGNEDWESPTSRSSCPLPPFVVGGREIISERFT